MAAIDDISKLYVGYFNRAPDPAGLNFWVAQYTALGQTPAALAGIAQSFSQVSEATNLYGFLSAPLVGSPTGFLTSLYSNLFGRVIDTAGSDFWVGQLNAGVPVGSIIQNIISGAQGDDALVVANKSLVAKTFAQNLLDNNAVFSSTLAASALTGVTKDAATATAKIATNLTAIQGSAGSAGGSTFTLTTGADNLTGTSANDTINASAVYDATEVITATSTISVADQIAGGAGTDTLNLTVSGAQDAAVVLPAATITAVEVLNVRNTVTQTASIDASTVAGLTAVNADRAVGAVTVTNLASGASGGVIGNGAVVNGAFNLGYVAAATAATLNVSGGTTAGAVTLSGAGLTSTTVTSTGAANTIGALTLAATTTSATIDATTNLTTGAVTNTTAAALTTLTVKGAGAVNLSATALESTVTKIDASANTGGLTVALGTAVTQTVTGGTGNDSITSGAVLTTGSVNAGTGTDTLVLGANVAHANTASLAAKYTGFEALSVNGTFDASLIAGINAIVLSGAVNAITNLSATQAAAVSATADIGATTLALTTATGTSDVLNLTMGTGKGAAFDAGALTITGFETLNLTANALSTNADTTTTIASFTAADLTAITLKGTSVTLSDAATTKAVTIDGSALTGILTIAGNVVTGSTVTGSAGKDVATFGTGFATYNTGAGDDTINATAAQLNTGANYNILNAGDGTDTLNITGGVALTIVDNNLSKVSGVEKIIVATTGANNQSIATGGFFDTAFKTSGVNLTTTTSTGTVTIDMTSFSGAATLTVTTAGGLAAEGVVSVQTGSGNDSVTVTSAAASNAGTISTFAGNDTIVGSVNDETITGGKGTDTMTGGGTTANIFKFSAGDSGGAPSATVFDTITDFSVVAANVIDSGAAAIVTNATASSGVATISAAGLATFNAADTSLAQHIVAVEAAINAGGVAAAGQAAMWDEGTDTYLFISDGVDGIGANDLLVKLVGVDTANAAFDTLTDGGTTFTIA